MAAAGMGSVLQGAFVFALVAILFVIALNRGMPEHGTGAREASLALIPKRASARRHRCHSDPAILRYALKGTSKPRHVTRTAGLTFRLHFRTYGGARTNALAIGNNVCIGWRLLLRHRPRDGSVVSSPIA